MQYQYQWKPALLGSNLFDGEIVSGKDNQGDND